MTEIFYSIKDMKWKLLDSLKNLEAIEEMRWLSEN